MTHKTKKIFMITIPIVLIIVIAIILVMLYFTTDFLKSNQTLFLKYLSQNVDTFKKLTDNTSEKEYTNLLRQNKYEATTELTGSYTEKMNTSEENKNNDINKIKLTIDEQAEYLNNYEYKDMRLLYNNENILRTEYIHEGEKYGIRFPEKFNQFLAIDNNDLKNVASKLGMTEKQIELIPEQIEEGKLYDLFNFTDEELATLQERYLNVISANISSDKYSKQKDAMITVGNNSINTTAYSVTLTEEQTNNIYLKILEQLKNDEIILNKITQFEPGALILNTVKNDENAKNNNYLKELYVSKIEQTIEDIQKNNIGTKEVKCTVYVSNGITVRTQLLEETSQTIIDSQATDNGMEINIEINDANEQQEIGKNYKIVKTNTEGESIFSIKAENTLGEQTSTTEFYRNKKKNEDTATIETGINYNDGKNNLLKINLNQQINLNQDFDKKVKLDEKNSVIINNYEAANVSTWANQVMEFLKSKYTERLATVTNIQKIEPIGKIFGQVQTEPIVQENTEITEVEKNRFNAKFEFYTGKEKTSAEVIQLLEETKNSLTGAQVSYSNEGSTNDTKKLQSIRLNIEENNKNVELVNSIKEMIEENQTYTVEIEKDSNDVATNITITANK